MAKLVSKTYGDALFQTAMEDNRLDEFLNATVLVTTVLQENKEYRALLISPRVIQDEKIQLVEETFTGKVPKELVGLLTLLVSKGRAKDIMDVLEYFIVLAKEEKKIGQAQVVTAVSLNDSQKNAVEQKLLTTTQYESFEMNYSVDKSLLGGMVIRIGDRVVDSSVKTKLYEMTRTLRDVQI